MARLRVRISAAALLGALLWSVVGQAQRAASPAASSSSAFSLEQVMSYPFPAELVASPTGDRLAWTFVTKGVRSIWVADGPDYRALPLVTYTPEDGQELSAVAFSGDGKHVVYVRGGDSGSNWPAERNLLPNPTSSAVQPKQQVWAVAVGGGSGAGAGNDGASGAAAVGVNGRDAGSGGARGGTRVPSATSAENAASSTTNRGSDVTDAAASASSDAVAVLLGEGEAPAPSPAGDRVAFVRDREIWIAPIDGSKPAARLFFARGENSAPTWSPDGRTLAFVSTRGSLGYIGLYSGDDQPLRYLSPSLALDELPRWSPDGTRVAFVRRPGRGGPATPPLEGRPQPWSIYVADVKSGDAREVWRSPDTLPGSYPRTQGGPNLAWGADDRLVFLSYEDGWPHLYSVSAKTTAGAGPATGGNTSAGGTTPAAATGAAPNQALLLTPGAFHVEFVTLTPDRRFVIYNANTGDDRDDIERRHLFKVPVDAATPVALTRGPGLEWSPVVTASGRTLAFLGATAQQPALPFVRPLDQTAANASLTRPLGADQLARDFPAGQLITPEHVTFTAADGTLVHGQLFKPRSPTARAATASAATKPAGKRAASGAAAPTGVAVTGAASEARRPAVVFVHGGPPRQMLLGWHYMFYYANAYALNQYLASRGFIVLSVNYRLGIGYGYAFHNPRDGGARGASEYQDVLAGGRYLQTRADVDPKRIGIWGGSYGGYLTALALGRNSDVFAAGVDIHGVHNRASQPPEALAVAAAVGDGVTRAQLDEAARVAWASSPVASVSTWRSPVLLIHGDDDRNVRVEQSVDLARRLKAAGVPFEEIVIPDEIHDFLLYRSWLRVNRATTEFLERQLKPVTVGTGSR